MLVGGAANTAAAVMGSNAEVQVRAFAVTVQAVGASPYTGGLVRAIAVGSIGGIRVPATTVVQASDAAQGAACSTTIGYTTVMIVSRVTRRP